MSDQFLPDYLVTPGEILEGYLDDIGMSQADLSNRTGMAKKTINEIIKGKSPITSETALKLERTIGRPARFWNNLERQYQEDRTRLAEQQKLENHLDWLKRFSINEMVKMGWIPKRDNKIECLEELLRFFGIASPEQWEAVCQVAYRQTQKFKTRAESISAWLRKGEIEAQKITCQPFDRKRFQAVLNEIRELTNEDPEVFIRKLIGLCASAGVAVVFVPELSNTGTYGATRWINSKAIIQLSLRYKSNDHLWFTFFHEAGHIIKHGRREVFVESRNSAGDRDKEREADSFARDKLIPPSDYKRLIDKGRPTLADIEIFARKINIAPGIVVGRLQYEEILPYSVGNKLKAHYKWRE